MKSNGSQCPEDNNSTDCLLRAVLQSLNEQKEADDTEINWDPISFAFTVLIGILALLFASATILQAIIATGKSRRVTSNRAIGKWSRQTRKTWSWTEMNFQYTACTPILLETLFPPIREQCEESLDGSHVDEDCDNHETENYPNEAQTRRKLQRRSITGTKRSRMPSRTRVRESWAPQLKGGKFWSEVPKLSQSPSHHPSAAWLEFFKEVGLDKLEIPDWNDSIREVSADYLPDDLMAAPAYGQVGAIIAAAATAGIQKLYIDQQNYPIVLGHGFQIDFRQHPSLGLIGAYSRYGKASRIESSGGLDELRFAMQYGRGVVPFHGSGTLDVYAKSSRRRILGRWCMGQKGFALQHRTEEDKYFFIDPDALSEAFLPLIIGLQARTPKYIPALFPVASMRTGFPLTALALQGTYWAREDLRRYSESHIYQWPENHFPESWEGFEWHDIGDQNVRPDIRDMYRDLDPKWVDFFAGMRGVFVEKLSHRDSLQAYVTNHSAIMGAGAAGDPVSQPADKPAEEPRNRGTEEIEAADAHVLDTAAISTGPGLEAFDGHRVVLHMCLKLLYRPEELQAWFFGASPVEQRALRFIILEQMEQVDQWLDRKVPNSGTRSVFLCNTTIFFSRAEKIIDESPNCLAIHADNSKNIGPQDSVESARTIHNHTLRTLRRLVTKPEENECLVEQLERFVDTDPKYYPSRNLWDRIRVLVQNNLEEDTQSDQSRRSGVPGEPGESEERVKNADDVIIYRCLMMILLFQTAADSSKILESGLWDTVVPFI